MQVFNKDGIQILSGYLSISGVCSGTIQPDGKLSRNIYARNYQIDTVYLNNSTDTNGYYSVEPLFITIDPEDTTEVEIHLEKYLTTKEITNCNDPEVVAFPNPFSESVEFIIDLPHYVPGNSQLKIFDTRGRLLTSYQIRSKSTNLTWNVYDDIPPGVYIYQLVVAGKVLLASKMVKQ
jgi:hypothetical protein